MGCDEVDGPTDVETDHDNQNHESDDMGASALGTLGTEGGTEPRQDQYLTLRPTGDGVATFEATVDGYIKSADNLGAKIPGLGKSAEDAIQNEPRQYILTGELTSIRITGPAAAFLDGERVA
ncbi:hypothetical protein G3I44_06520 [Halogeometricum borinquense]|uniref:Uncharacterized protein n=1 Tax=Halogeometricum borinquense TaxID=60847 RepID=A0A6C0UEX1_9EURY|nr:hypothetical protein [Halogeometricum borinquense]QIB73976.1 hypothetical protein G3I44_06520 [Halogeometricum borinquense]